MNDKPGAASRHQLGWWKEPEAVSAAPTAEKQAPWWQGEMARRDVGVSEIRSEPEAIAAESIAPDIGQELEEEALRRANSHAVDHLVEIYAKPHEINAKALRSLKVFTAAVAAFTVIQALVLHDPK